MKIIARDNFDRGTVDDVLVAENVDSFYAPFIVEELNTRFSGKDAPRFFSFEPDDYKLHKWKP